MAALEDDRIHLVIKFVEVFHRVQREESRKLARSCLIEREMTRRNREHFTGGCGSNDAPDVQSFFLVQCRISTCVLRSL